MHFYKLKFSLDILKDVASTEQFASISTWSSSTQVPNHVEQQEDKIEEAKGIENDSYLQIETDEDCPAILVLGSDPGI